MVRKGQIGKLSGGQRGQIARGGKGKHFHRGALPHSYGAPLFIIIIITIYFYLQYSSTLTIVLFKLFKTDLMIKNIRPNLILLVLVHT